MPVQVKRPQSLKTEKWWVLDRGGAGDRRTFISAANRDIEGEVARGRVPR